MCGSFLLIYFLKIKSFIEIDFCIPELIQGFVFEFKFVVFNLFKGHVF